MASKKIVMLVGDFVEDYEVMVPFQILVCVGHEVAVICPDKRAGDTVATAVHDFGEEQTYSEKRGHNFRLTAAFSGCRPGDFDALVIPGGRAPEYLRLNRRVLEFVRHFAEEGKPIAAICHGLQLLAAADLVRGKKCQGYPAIRPELEQAGAVWDEPSPLLDSACVDGSLVTAPAWPAHPAWMRAFLVLLATPVGID